MYVTLANDEIPLDLLTRIAEGEMDAYFHNTILDRAESYYDERYWTLGAVGGGNLHATVRGTRVYSVQLKVDMSGLSLDCSCPYEGECKHLAVFVWSITEEWRDELKRALISDAPAEEAFTQHLNTLSKDALKDLVKQFAPTEFRQSILLRAAPADTVEHELQVVLGRVARLFGYREYYETPGDYEDELEARLKELEPFMALRGRAVLDTLRNIWIDINERMGRGELYDDYNDGPFENGALVYFAARLVYAQPEDARADYLRELRSMRQVIEEYDTFGGLIGALLEEAPDDRALQHLAPVLTEPETLVLADHRERRALLDRLQPLLDEVQEKQLLEALVNKQDHYFSVALARLLERQEGAEAGRKFLKKALRGDTSYSWDVSTAFQCLVELTASARGKSAERKVLLDYLQRAGSAEALRFAITRRPELAEEFTQLVEARQPSFLLYYFIEEDAHARAIDLLDRHEPLWNDKRTYDLLLSYATTYPDHARKLVYQMLDEHLPQAHRRAYAEVVRALQLLRAVGPVEELLQVVSDIKATYRRRSLLMGMVGGDVRGGSLASPLNAVVLTLLFCCRMPTLTPYHAAYFAHQLTRRAPANSLEKFAATLVDAQVDLNPHQVEAALFAFRSPLSKGAILADEVGLGKTIEAGLVLSQKWAERKRRILIIAPSSLRKQWNQELADKFFLPSTIIEKKFFDNEIKRGNLNPFQQQDQIVICSYHFAKNKESYLTQLNWDLAVLDEAHKLRNVYRNDNQIGTSIRDSLRNVPKLLLTATPLQNSLLELYGMVSIIDERHFGDLSSFKDRYSRLDANTFAELQQRLQPVCKRTLRRDVLEYIKYTNRKPLLQPYRPFADEQRLYDLVSDYLQRENLFALPASQRTLMTLILRKLLASSTYAISGTLTRLAEKLEVMLKHSKSSGSSDDLGEDYEALDDTTDEWGDAADTVIKVDFTEVELEQIENELLELKDASALANAIKRNAKGEALLKALKTGFNAIAEQGANRKAMIFTESRRTQDYLLKLLEDNGYQDEVVLFNGDNKSVKSQRIYRDYLRQHQGTDRISGAKSADLRAALVDHFRNTASIMVATEAAAEGINLQFCSLLVNYDLPWNPQRIEQRIGRCHRYGQLHDVVVVNFLNEANAADRRVYELLNTKFNLFSGVFGASDEVLGSIESGVDIEKRIAGIYQTCRTEAEIQEGFDRLQAEMEAQISTRMKLTKQQVIENFDEEVHEKLRISLEKSRDYLNTYENWLWQLTLFALAEVATFADDGAHAFSLLRNPFTEHIIPTGRYQLGRTTGQAYTYRIGHPLAQAIMEQVRTRPLADRNLLFNYRSAPQKISILEPLLDQSGILRVSSLSIQSFEREDYLCLVGFTDSGQALSREQCERLFSLPATTEGIWAGTQVQIESLEQGFLAFQTELLAENMQRNGTFFDEEMEKLDHWADDQKTALDLRLGQLEQEIKARKTTARKLATLADKLAEQQAIKKLEAQRNDLRGRLFTAQDEVDLRKEKLLDDIEKRMQQQVESTTVFTVRWKLV